MAIEYFSFKNGYPEVGYPRPDRIRMPDGSTRTVGINDNYSLEDLISAGYKKVLPPPYYDPNRQILTYELVGESLAFSTEVVVTDSSTDISSNIVHYDWKVTDIPIEQKSLEMRQLRDIRIDEIMWRVYRHQRQTRLGLPTTDDIAKLDEYIQALCDVPEQEGFPYNIKWPVFEE
jgi:hypothetical protein